MEHRHPPAAVTGTTDMLRILLDEHLSPKVAQQLPRRRPGTGIVSLQAWEDGTYLQARDEVMLATACEQGLTLLTYDLRTIVPLLKSLGEQGISHGGVILVDDSTIRQCDIGGLVRALERLLDSQGHLEWRNRVVYLTR